MTQSLILLIPLLVAGIIARKYSYRVKKEAPAEQIWGWRHNLYATMVSVLIGVSIAIFLFNIQNYLSDISKRNNFNILLAAQMTDTLRGISGEPLKVKIGRDTIGVVITTLQPNLLESAASSGLYSHDVTEFMIHFSREMALYNLLVGHFMSLLAAGVKDARAEELMRLQLFVLNNTVEGIKKECHKLMDNLHLPTSPYDEQGHLKE